VVGTFFFFDCLLFMVISFAFFLLFIVVGTVTFEERDCWSIGLGSRGFQRSVKITLNPTLPNSLVLRLYVEPTVNRAFVEIA